MKKLYHKFSILFLLSIFSCISQDHGEIVIREINNSDYPFKIFRYDDYEKPNNNLIRLFIPKVIEIENGFNKTINLSNSYFSVKGGNIDSGLIYILIENKLENTFSNINFESKEKRKFITYSSYKIVLSDEEYDQIMEKAQFTQYLLKSKKEVYDVGKLNETPEFLRTKVPDSLKGFIYLKFYNPKTKKFFGENIKINF